MHFKLWLGKLSSKHLKREGLVCGNVRPISFKVIYQVAEFHFSQAWQPAAGSLEVKVYWLFASTKLNKMSFNTLLNKVDKTDLAGADPANRTLIECIRLGRQDRRAVVKVNPVTRR
ncbi:hypothetical protein D3C85_1427930 [compost metagenome]